MLVLWLTEMFVQFVIEESGWHVEDLKSFLRSFCTFDLSNLLFMTDCHCFHRLCVIMNMTSKGVQKQITDNL